MKDLIRVEYKKIGHEGFYALVKHCDSVGSGWGEEEFFSEEWKVLVDKVLFFIAEMKF